MKPSQVPYYIDPDDFEMLENNASFPCSSNFMRYNTLLSRYMLTNEGLQHYGITAPSSGSMNGVSEFSEEVTSDLYTVVARLAPFNSQYNSYRVAKSQSHQIPSRYACRKQFEKALVYQARYKLINVDVRELNGIDLESGTSIYHKQLRKEFRHISPKALDILKSLGLFFNGNIPTKHLINYKEEM